ncbi:MAG TPA: response regulator [Gracilimonas sp.]|uniref:response regulator n=1 Tax=Gracilimonas sp. TaxID=1974203 RepID=UPI002DA1B90B|nr:response regulator [Gracilimonas sp.]
MIQEDPLILVVEDTEVIYELLLYKLRKEGYRVEHRDNGKEGLKAARELMPDLVLLDVMLPSMNGFEVLRNIKEDPETKDIKVIMLTSKNREEDILKGHKLGAERYIEKPFKPNVLMLRIEEVLKS